MRSRSTARRSSTPSGPTSDDSARTPAKAWRGRPGSSSARALPRRACGGGVACRTCPLPPRTPGEARDRLRALAVRLEADPPTWGGSAGAAQAIRAADPTRDRIVSFVGKLIASKGVDLLIAAWPLVIESAPDARLMIAGFGAYREALLELVRALGDGNLAAARVIASRGRELEGGPAGELHFLAAFLDGLAGAGQERYLH